MSNLTVYIGDFMAHSAVKHFINIPARRLHIMNNFISLIDDESAECFIYTNNDKIQRQRDKAILSCGGIPYLSPELVLMYKLTDTAREVNRTDFETYGRQIEAVAG